MIIKRALLLSVFLLLAPLLVLSQEQRPPLIPLSQGTGGGPAAAAANSANSIGGLSDDPISAGEIVHINVFDAPDFSLTTRVSADAVCDTEQSLGGEDFGWFLEKVPGALARLGVRSLEAVVAPDLHQPAFDVDERCLDVGVRLLARTAAPGA